MKPLQPKLTVRSSRHISPFSQGGAIFKFLQMHGSTVGGNVPRWQNIHKILRREGGGNEASPVPVPKQRSREQGGSNYQDPPSPCWEPRWCGNRDPMFINEMVRVDFSYK